MKNFLFLLFFPIICCTQTKELPVEKSLKVVELFTSEGCSSCPPADLLVEKLSKIKQDNVIILAYHVDYWDRLGWKDAFSQSKFSERQRKYANYFNLNTIYTPQIVVNGEEQFVGSDESALNSALKKSAKSSKISGLKIQIWKADQHKISITYILESFDSNEKLNFALVQNAAVTQVKRGENSNRTLSHVDIVIDFQSVNAAKSGTVLLDSEKFRSSDFHIVAFLQNEKTGHILEAKTASLE